MRHRKSNHHRILRDRVVSWRFLWVVEILCIWMNLGHSICVGDVLDHDSAKGGVKDVPIDNPSVRAQAGADKQDGAPPQCRVRPSALASFANDDPRKDFSSMVAFLTAPECSSAAPEIAQMAISSGVSFSGKGPIRLDNFARGLASNSLASSKRLDLDLRKSIPAMLAGQSLSAREMLPLLGKVSLLSQSSGRYLLGKLNVQELYAGDDLLKAQSGQGAEVVAAELAKTLVRLGAGENLIASEMAENVEEMALLAQADSLGKYFRALSAAATAEATLIPTFNLSAGALNRGVQRGAKFYRNDDSDLLLASVFSAITSAIQGSPSLETGAAELNEACGVLMSGEPLTATGLKSMWGQVMWILSLTTTQNSLAEAVALSLTPEFVFMVPSRQHDLMAASRNYPQIAGAVQNTFLKSWAKMWHGAHSGQLALSQFNHMKRQYFEPMVVDILDWNPYLIDPVWLSTVVSAGLVRDEDIEKRFPRYVLAFLERGTGRQTGRGRKAASNPPRAFWLRIWPSYGPCQAYMFRRF